MRKVASILCLLALAACEASSVPMASRADDMAGKQFGSPPPGSAAVYFYNPSTASPILRVAVDGRNIGALGTQTWVRAEISSGHHVFRCRGGDSSNAIWLNLAAGEMRFIDVQMLPGDSICTIRETSPESGRAGVLAGSRAFQPG